MTNFSTYTYTADEWMDFASADAKGLAPPPGSQDILREPGNIEDWIDALVALLQDVDVQLAERRSSDEEYLAPLGDDKEARRLRRNETLRWRKGILRYQWYLLRRLREAKKLFSLSNPVQPDLEGGFE